MSSTIIGMAACRVDKAPNTITTLGLGSCIGLTLYDPRLKVGGMAHMVMPRATPGSEGNPLKCVDSGVDYLIQQLLRAGANIYTLQAKMAGGAQMFGFENKNTQDVLRIGERNIESCRQRLALRKIALVAEDVGGNKGRTIELELETGLLMVRTLGASQKYM